LVSLWSVLVSIGGLFRPRGRPFAVSDLPTAPARTPPTDAVIARQSLVLRPRATSIAGVLLLGVLLGMRAEPAHGQPGGQPAQPAPTLPTVPLPTLPAPNPQIRLPSTAAEPAGDTRTVVFTLRDLGASGPMTMRGTSTIQGLLFGIRGDEVVTDARLSLSGAMSPALLPDLSNVMVTLNEQYVGTVPVNTNRPEFGPLEMPINPVFFQDRNRLNFRFTGRYTPECNDPLSGLLWATMSDASTLTPTMARLPRRRDLARLPQPLFDENVRQKLVLPFVLPASPANETLQAAAIVASWLGRLADFRGASFPVANEPPQDGNAVLVTVGRDAPPGLNLPAINGPTIAEIANPNDKLATLLVVGGRTPAETLAAANSLSLGSRVLSGEKALAQVVTLPVHRPYDAPAWISTERAVQFGELVDASALQGVGYVPGTFHVPFGTSPDLYTWRRRPFQSSIQFRAPPGPVVDVAASRLDVSINGIFLQSFSLAPEDTTRDWILRNLGYSQPVRNGSTPVPLYTVFGENDLQLFFDARPCIAAIAWRSRKTCACRSIRAPRSISARPTTSRRCRTWRSSSAPASRSPGWQTCRTPQWCCRSSRRRSS
jgi:cellulose synthase (UDP-forming)